MIDINEGRTNNYLVHGIGVIALSLICLGLSFVISDLLLIGFFILFSIAIVLFSATNGLEIDVVNMRYRSYGKMITYKMGAWRTMINATSVTLKMSASNGQKEANIGPGYLPPMNTKLINYSVVLTDTLDFDQVLFDFLDYKKAKQAMLEITNSLNIPMTNLVAEKLAENRSTRRNRR